MEEEKNESIWEKNWKKLKGKSINKLFKEKKTNFNAKDIGHGE